MKTILTLLLFCCGAAGAAEPAAPAASTAPAAAAAVPPRYAPEVLQVMKHLSLLLERDAEIPPERLDALAPRLAEFDGKVREALGEKILADVARREKELEEKARGESALKTLQSLRATLQVAYAESGGKYPKSPADLAPKYFPALPELWLPGHDRTAKIKLVDSRKYDGNIAKAVGDSGGWLYFTNPDSANYGMLLIDCTHVGPEGAKFYEY